MLITWTDNVVLRVLISIWVKCRRLDRLLANLGLETVDLIKIDVEGAEYEVLRGLDDIFKYQGPRILVVEMDMNYDQINKIRKEYNFTKTYMLDSWNGRANIGFIK